MPSNGPNSQFRGVATVRQAAAAPPPPPRSGNTGNSEHKRGWPEWIRASIVPVLVAVAVAGLSPLGDGLRELFFPTRASVTGAVTLRGSPLPDAALELDGRPVGATDENGSFVLARVGNGQHRLDAAFGGTYHASTQFSVARGAADLPIGALELRPPLNLGYAILALRATDKKNVFAYDLVLWVRGGGDVLRRVRQVSYRLPAPLPEDPIPAGAAAAAYCYRQQGTLAYEGVAEPKLDAATAMVRLDDGAAYSIPAGPNSTAPPQCEVRIARPLRVPSKEPGAAPTRATWPAGPRITTSAPPVEHKDEVPAAERPRVVSVRALPMEPCDTVRATREVNFQLSAENATAYQASSRSGSAAGTVRNGFADITLLLRCTGATDTFTFRVSDRDGNASEAYRMGVNTGLRTPAPTKTNQ